MRWKGIIFIVLFSAVLIALSVIFSDTWLENKIEQTASEINGAKVEIDNLDFSLFNMRMRWDKMQVANPEAPMKNIFETGKTGLDLAFMPLIRRKIVIDTVQVTALKTNTDREKSGELPPKIKKKIKTEEKTEPGLAEKTGMKLKSKAEDYKDLRLDAMKQELNVDSIMLAVDLASIEYIDSVKKSMEERYAHWNEVLSSEEFQQDFAKLKTEYETLKEIDPKKIKTVDDLKKTVKKLEKSKEKFDKVYDKVQKYEKDFNKDLKNVQIAGDAINEKVKTDYREIENMAKIPDIDTKNMTSFIFGETVVDRINRFFEITQKIAYYKDKLSSDKPKKEKLLRKQGKYIEFSEKYKYPDFWIKNAIFSGELESNTAISGRIHDIVSDQKLIDKPTVATISGSNPDASKIDINAEIDSRTKEAFDHYELNYSGFPINDYTISRSSIFPYDVKDGKGNVTAGIKINRSGYKGQLNFDGSEMNFVKNTAKKSKTELQKFLDQSVQKLDQLQVSSQFSNEDLSLSSNIDEIFNQEIKSYIDENIAEAKNKVRGEIDKKVNKARADLTEYQESAVADIEKQLNQYKEQIDEYLAEIEDKKSETEKEIKKKGADALKNLF